MPSLEDTRASVLSNINVYWPAMLSAQAARLASRGSYLQRKATHSVIPVDGAAVSPDSLADIPTDETETGEEYFTFPAQMDVCAAVNVLDGPAGHSFTCIFEFDWTATGMRQRYEIKGPTRVDSGWTEYDPTATLP